MAADMQYVRRILSSPQWAGKATLALRNRKFAAAAAAAAAFVSMLTAVHRRTGLQKLLDGERKRGKIRTKLVAVLEPDERDARKMFIGIRVATKK